MTDVAGDTHAREPDLAGDLRKLIDDAEALLRHAAHEAGDEYGRARSQLERSIEAAKAGIGTVEDTVAAADDYVRRHPWEAVAIGAALGLVAGLLLGRK